MTYLERNKAQEIWDKTENILKKKHIDPQEYNICWGEEREKFYRLFGPFKCPSNEIERLDSLHNMYRGERIFIIGNGPSLKTIDMEKLTTEWTFGVNRIYLFFDKIEWRPSFYTITDWRVAPDIASEINMLSGMTFFFPERFRGLLQSGDDVYWFWKHKGMTADKNAPMSERFAYDIHTGVRSGGSVLVTAIQIAFHLGFTQIYLIGADLDYSVPNTVKQSGPMIDGVGLYLESTLDDDLNHFDSRYFGRYRRWRAPNILEMIKGFENCKDALENKDCKIFNATKGGKLNIFERVEYEKLF